MKKSRIEWNRNGSASSNARAKLPALARDFFRAGDDLAAAGAGPLEAHSFRIATKQFRYTLELFRPCYDRQLERRLQSLREVQQCLGDLNDFVTLRRLAEGDEMRSALDIHIGARIQEFHALWQGRFGKAVQNRWAQYLRGKIAVRKKLPPVG